MKHADFWLQTHDYIDSCLLCQSISLFATVDQMLKCHWSLQAGLVYRLLRIH